MRTGSQPGMMHDMSAAEHMSRAAKLERDAVSDDAEGHDHASAGRYAAAHRAFLNGAVSRGSARAHRELAGRRYLSPLGRE